MAFGQQLKSKAFQNAELQKTKDENNLNFSGNNLKSFKAPGDVIWEENFDAAVALPNGWSAVDNNNFDAFWEVVPPGDLPDADFTSGLTTIASTSGQNCILLYSDLYQTPIPNGGYYQMDTYFQTAAIPVDNIPGINIEFQQRFRNCCAGTPVVVLSVSRDAAFTDPTEYSILGGVGNTSPTLMNMSINISDVAANYSGDIYLRFHIQSGIEAYYWMIDDIKLVESQANDIIASSASAHFWGVEYSRVPVSQLMELSAYMIGQNSGSDDQPNTKLTATVDDGTTQTNFSTDGITLPTVTTDTFELDSFWMPESIPGKRYQVTLDITSDNTDITPENNSIVTPAFEVTDGIMALDDYSETPGSSGAGRNQRPDYEIANSFDCIADAPIYSIEFVTGDGTPTDGSVYVSAKLYQRTVTDGSESFSLLWASEPYQVTAGDINNPKKLGNTDGSPIANLESANVYYAVIQTFADFEYAVSGSGPLSGTPTAFHSRIAYPTFSNPDNTYTISSTPMIRLDFKEGPVGIEDENGTASFSVYPNPNNGEFTIRLDNNVKTANISVRNVVGQSVLNKTINVVGKTSEKISLTDYSKGVYFLTVNEETIKLIVE
jgi:hypothetical protein